MNSKRMLVLGIVVGFILGGALSVFASSVIQAILNDQVKVLLNGEVQTFVDETTGEMQYPITYKDRTYLPLRNIANLVGLEIDYDAETNSILLGKNEKTIKELTPSKKYDMDHIECAPDAGNASEYYYEDLGDAVWVGFGNSYSASSYLQEGDKKYEAINLRSVLDLDNCWAEGVAGSGLGETITVKAFGSSEHVSWHGGDQDNHDDVIKFLLNDYNDVVEEATSNSHNKNQLPPKITSANIDNYSNNMKSIAIINGYAKNEETFKNNNRVKKFKLTINNDDEYILDLEDFMGVQVFDLEYSCRLSKPIELKFEILEVYKGEKYDDTCVTMLYVDGSSDNPWYPYGGR